MSIRAMFVGNAPARAVAAAKKPAAVPPDSAEPPPTRDIVRDEAPALLREKPHTPAAPDGPRD